ncbi:MAG TPA: PhoH family protein [Kiritimatiellia bacterium]|nr:PhoH family protein [Kiritimatiellia bacterium]HMO98876.1 PhoH family protein [Kiritimatiellia bacterium]HMP97632.1 PhoH family protein [Kiritimatiellia bacterium]
MSSETTFHFDNAREAQELTGRGMEYFPAMERALGVSLTTRDLWLVIQGPEPAVRRATAFFDLIRNARNQGITLREPGVLFTLQAFVQGQDQELRRLFATRIDVAPGKAPVFPKTFGQLKYLDAIRHYDCVFGIGPAGTGKTYQAMAMAVSSLLRGEVSRIILTRPAVEAGENLGYLPGDLREKVLPYLRPLYDALHDMMDAAEIEKHVERGVIEIAPLAFMRGRTLNHAFVILDEAQNTTPEQMLMFLTRLGFDSKCVITGDLTQIDLPAHKISGLLEARQALRATEGVVMVELTDADVVRHALVQRIILAYRDLREQSERDLPRSRS